MKKIFLIKWMLVNLFLEDTTWGVDSFTCK